MTLYFVFGSVFGAILGSIVTAIVTLEPRVKQARDLERAQASANAALADDGPTVAECIAALEAAQDALLIQRRAINQQQAVIMALAGREPPELHLWQN